MHVHNNQRHTITNIAQIWICRFQTQLIDNNLSILDFALVVEFNIMVFANIYIFFFIVCIRLSGVSKDTIYSFNNVYILTTYLLVERKPCVETFRIQTIRTRSLTVAYMSATIHHTTYINISLFTIRRLSGSSLNLQSSTYPIQKQTFNFSLTA